MLKNAKSLFAGIPNISVTVSLIVFSTAASLIAAPPTRITRAIDSSRVTAAPGHVHRLAQPQYDRGAVDPSKQLNNIMLLLKPSAAQQADLEKLIADQQNPSSKNYRGWLTPEQFAGRFGLNTSDQSKIAAWLTGQGFSINHRARSANWISFSGTAAQVSNTFRTEIHQFQVDGETHYANTAVPSIPEALSGIVAGFRGLDDFHPHPNAKIVRPEYTAGALHFLAPSDWTTIYDVNPLYNSGIDGTGQNIVVVGQSDVLLTDIAKFRSNYGLSANVPKTVLYSTPDPGFTSSQLEGNLDIEWAGAIAPKATIYYVYGEDVFDAMIVAIELNFAPVISVSYLTCEIDADDSEWEAIAQQANAQGITIMAASGDAGAAGCDAQFSEPLADRGISVVFPAVLPEVTGVGGTQFVEGSGNYWATTNSPTLGSALGYIPESAWNESSTAGLASTGGGASQIYPKPLWQSGPGVPNDNVRHVPDVAFSAAGHDAYFVYYSGATVEVEGTSCATPSMSALMALLNHYQVTNKFQAAPGLGNINPQLYRLAQTSTSPFHDITTGNNIVQCAQGSPDCSTGSFGYSAATGYDQTTGLGSFDANSLITQWNKSVSASVVTITTSASKATLNDTITVTATVTAASGSGTPTGTVSFVDYLIPLGAMPLVNGSATISVPLYELGYAEPGIPITAEYSGDASFSSSSATKTITVTLPTGGVTSIVPSAPVTVWPEPADAQGLSWRTQMSLVEMAGVPALVTGLTIDGVAQTLLQYVPSPSIPPKGVLNLSFVFRNLNAPVTKTFVFTGTDPTGATWSRQVAILYAALPNDSYYNLNVTPLTVVENPANTACPWSVQLNLDDQGGFGINTITYLQQGYVNITANAAALFGTTRLDAFGGLVGTLCYSGLTVPATDSVYLNLDGGVTGVSFNFVGPPAHPGTLSVSPATLSIAAPVPTPNPTVGATVTGVATLNVNLSDSTQSWTATVYPLNRTTSWLTASALSGNGSGTIMLTANGAGFEPGVYRATIVLQSQNAVPQYINVPVMFVYGGSTSGTAITAVANAASFKTAVAPGMLLSVLGTKLAGATPASASGDPLPYTTAGVSATVNGLAAPVVYASAGQLNIQVPYAAGAGPATLGVNNNGQIAGFQFEIAPSAPGIFADANGNLVPTPTVAQGSAVALYVTGTGEVSPALKTAYSPFVGTALSSLPVPVLPLSVTVGGTPAFVEFAGITPGLIGVMQVNILVPSSVPTGNQPLVVTVNGVASAPVNVVVQPGS